MSTGNDNFITVDSIAEIQDITDGDFLFSISNGVIYKLDFSNFIITLDNTDFGTNYRALSTQVTINTAVLSALGFLGGEQFNIIDQLIDAYEVVSELSAAWTASYNSVFNLSSTRWLPVPSVDEPFQSGAICYWDGSARDWVSLNPGLPGDPLIINGQGLPSYTDESGRNVISEGTILLDSQATIGREYKNSAYEKIVPVGDTITDRYTNITISTGLVFEVKLNPAINQNPVKVVKKKKKKKKWYKKIGDAFSGGGVLGATLGLVAAPFTGGLSLLGGAALGAAAGTALGAAGFLPGGQPEDPGTTVLLNKSLSPQFGGSNIQLLVDGTELPTGNGTGVIPNGNNASQLPVNIAAKITGNLTWNNKLNYFDLELVYKITGARATNEG